MAYGALAFMAVVVLGARRNAALDGAEFAAADPRKRRSFLPESMRRELAKAGLSEPSTQMAYVGIHAACTVAGAGGAAWWATRNGSTPVMATMISAAGMLAGWWLPRSWLVERQERRRAEIIAEFPLMLDLLSISLHGGLGLTAAWGVVATNLREKGDALAEEMHRIDVEVSFGARWSVSLAAAAERTGVEDFRSLGSLLDQTERFGTELTQVIRVLSDSLRHEELQGMEERAHRASVRVLFPVMLLLLPATLLIVIGPLLKILLETLSTVNSD